jgi:hypothetical protein
MSVLTSSVERAGACLERKRTFSGGWGTVDVEGVSRVVEKDGVSGMKPWELTRPCPF